MTKTYVRAILSASAGLFGGAAVSIAANVKAISIEQANPSAWAYGSAVVWPLALLIATEVMLHVPWVASWRDSLVRWGGLVLVALVAFWESYWHIAHDLNAWGYDRVAAHLGPLAIDVLMAMSALAINRVGRVHADIVPVSIPAPLPMPMSAQDEADVQALYADSDRTWLDDLADSAPLVADTTPAAPLTVVKGSVPADMPAMMAAWSSAPLDTRPKPSDRDALLAGHFGVTTRTIRRWAV